MIMDIIIISSLSLFKILCCKHFSQFFNEHCIYHFNSYIGTSLVVQWIRIRPPTQEIQVPSLGREDPDAAEQLSLCATTTEAARPHAWVRAPQQKKPPQGEALTPQWRVAPLNTTRESLRTEDPTQPKINKIKPYKKKWLHNNLP